MLCRSTSTYPKYLTDSSANGHCVYWSNWFFISSWTPTNSWVVLQNHIASSLFSLQRCSPPSSSGMRSVKPFFLALHWLGFNWDMISSCTFELQVNPVIFQKPSRGSGHHSVPPERCPLRTMLTRQIRHRKVWSGSLSSSSRHRNASRCYLTKFADREICCFSRPFMAGTLLGPPPPSAWWSGVHPKLVGGFLPWTFSMIKRHTFIFPFLAA